MAFLKKESVNAELFNHTKSAHVEFLEISEIPNSGDVIRLHGGANSINESIFFAGKEYFYIPYEGVDFGSRSDGRVSRPTIKIINYSGFLSKFMLGKDDLIRSRVTRIRTFFRFLDKENFLNYDADKGFWDKMGISPDPDATLRPDVWYINQKIEENKFYIEYELSNALDLEGAVLPRRQILNNYCTWKYRGKGCRYNGGVVADSNDVKFDKTSLNPKGEWTAGQSYILGDVVYVWTREGQDQRAIMYVCTEPHTSSKELRPSINTSNWAMDACSKTLGGCRLRFGEDNELPFGGFPSSRLY